MSPWEKLAENRIQEAIDSGELTAPAGEGALDLSGYFALPAADRVGISVLRNAGVVPPEVELLRAAATLERDIADAPPARAAELRALVQEVRVAFRMAMERRARVARET